MKKHNFTALILVCVLTLQTVLGAFQMQVLAEDNMSWSETAAETVLIGSEETLPEDFSADPEGSTELPYAPEGEEDLTEVSGEEAAEDESSTALEYIGDTSETPSAGTDSGEEGIVSDDMAAFPSFEQTKSIRLLPKSGIRI